MAGFEPASPGARSGALSIRRHDLFLYPDKKSAVTFGTCIVKSMNNSNYKNCQFSNYFTISTCRMKLVDSQFYYNRSCGLMDKALHFECGDCRFESCHDRHFCPFNLINYLTILKLPMISYLDPSKVGSHV